MEDKGGINTIERARKRELRYVLGEKFDRGVFLTSMLLGDLENFRVPINGGNFSLGTKFF